MDPVLAQARLLCCLGKEHRCTHLSVCVHRRRPQVRTLMSGARAANRLCKPITLLHFESGSAFAALLDITDSSCLNTPKGLSLLLWFQCSRKDRIPPSPGSSFCCMGSRKDVGVGYMEVEKRKGDVLALLCMGEFAAGGWGHS